jgi:hypothetical protein
MTPTEKRLRLLHIDFDPLPRDREVARSIAAYIDHHDRDWRRPTLAELSNKFPHASLRAYVMALALMRSR